MQPKNPDYAQRVRESFGRQAFMGLIGASIDNIEPGRCILRMPGATEFAQHRDQLQGGAIVSLADTAAGYAAFSMASANESILTVEFKINFLARAIGKTIVADASIVCVGQSLTVCEGRVYSELDGDKTLCAVILETLMLLPGRADSQTAARPSSRRRTAYVPALEDVSTRVAHDNFRDHVTEACSFQSFPAAIGMQIQTIDAGHCITFLPRRDDLTQQHGFFHGGVVAAMADLTMSAAAGTLAPIGTTMVAAEFKLNLMAPGDAQSLRAHGHVVRPGRTVSICRADVTNVDSDGNEYLCASAMGTMMGSVT